MSEPTVWHVRPNEGLAPILFDMTRAQVAALPVAGPPESTLSGRPGEVTEFRGLALPAVSYRQDKVFYIAIGPKSPRVLFEATDCFTEAPMQVVQAFERANRSPGVLQFGGLNFEALHVTLHGFYEEETDSFFDVGGAEQDDRSIVLQAPGTWESFPDMPSLRLSFL